MDIETIFRNKDNVLTIKRSLPQSLWVHINDIKDDYIKELITDIIKILRGQEYDLKSNEIKLTMRLINEIIKDKVQYKTIMKILKLIAPDYDKDKTKILDVDEIQEPDVVNEPTRFDDIPERNEKLQKKVFYMDFINSNVKNKTWLNNQVINKLHLIPKEDKDTATFQAATRDFMHQIDILFLPEDKKKYRYALCVCDVHSRLFDVQPLDDKTSSSVIKALKTIYKRNALSFPHEIICDDGKEFKGEFIKFCKDKDILLKPLIPGKHLGIIDMKIKILGDALLKRQTSIELLTNKSNTEWVDDLKDIVDLINEYTMKTYKPQSGLEHIDIRATGKIEILPLGTKVRTMLFKPKNLFVSNDKLTGSFRSSDLRWNNDVSVITNIIIRPNSPIMYTVDNDDMHRWTRNQLQTIGDSEELPRAAIIKDKKLRLLYEKSIK